MSLIQLKQIPKHVKKLTKETLYQIGFLPMQLLPHGTTRALCHIYETLDLTPENIITGFAQGIFPAPEIETKKIKWFDPNPRGILPLDDYHVSRSLKRAIRNTEHTVTVNKDFEGVVHACADRPETWLIPGLIETFIALHDREVAHSVEVWQNDQLVGGVFGIQIGSFYSGVSQFHRVSDAGKIATVYLCEILKANDFLLQDTGWSSPFLEQFGCIEIPREEFHIRHANAIIKPATFKMIDHQLFQ